MVSRPTGPGATYVSAMCSPGGTTTPSAMTEQPCYCISAGGAAAEKVYRERSCSQTPL